MYSYNTIKEKIASIILLSLIDIPDVQKFYLKDKYEEMLSVAKSIGENKLMPRAAFIHPISAKTYLRYFDEGSEIDFARYSEEYDYKELNSINIPLFMRWGNVNEMVIQNLDELVKTLKEKIKNAKLDIGYVDGADHGYTDKEEVLAEEILRFIENV